METFDVIVKLVDLIVKIAVLVIGGTWALYKYKEYRVFKKLVQLDLDATIYRLSEPENAQGKTWSKEGKPVELPNKEYKYAVEVLLNFSNKGKTRVKLFNIQLGINSMRQKNKAKFDKDDGHLHLTRILTSGNIVPKFPVKGKPIEETSFYYIEPGVDQTITYLCLISEPRELFQVYAMFSLDEKRLFPKTTRGAKGLYPHTVAKTFPIQISSANIATMVNLQDEKKT